MTAPKPIETRYAGCRFRSRLEARWAVFFDNLGITWQYETEGYELSTGDRYLPDFYLPDFDQWVEVKGKLTTRDLCRTAVAACELPTENSEQIHHGILFLGDVPEPGHPIWHSRIASLDGHLHIQYVFISPTEGVVPIGPSRVLRMPSFLHLNDDSLKRVAAKLIKSADGSYLKLDHAVDAAYRAARSARFEHGEQG
ncbi:hypothetical protein [Micromonospora carbonacea]|uniref:Uncharacterized protein n=1 Tax=Micromonospora carbonacea TaxID=47853 RepID=A0A1C5AAE2_9ACTN|nr:hypothetical protein [Micromonospora carbonacea]SCF42096.1 hypothetical protein GA0070563_11237 [Micromonospora carbonacea]